MAKRYNQTEQLGVAKIQTFFVENYHWIFRTQHVDFGIDAYIERVVDGDPTGELTAIQIKAGDKNIQENEDGFIFYFKSIHKENWLNYSLPVLLLYYRPADDQIYYSTISRKTVKRTPKKWKIFIPKSQNLQNVSIQRFERLLTKSSSNHKIDFTIDLQSIRENPIESTNHFNDVAASITKQREYLDIYLKKIEPMEEQFKELTAKILNSKGYSQERAVNQFRAKIHDVINSANILRNRIQPEVVIFQQSFVAGIVQVESLLKESIKLNLKRGKTPI